MKLLYITYIDFNDFSSGSRVRPQKMYQAFLDAGLDVVLLEGQQNRLHKRRKKARQILRWLKSDRPDICYIESPSGPVFNGIDLRIIKKVHKMGVPIGLFYRDAYWKLAEWWPVSGLKKLILTMMHKRDIRVFCKCCDIVYFPSSTMADLFEFKRKELLPPAGVLSPARDFKTTRTSIYVGGISPVFGTEILFEAFQKINANGTNVKLIVVTRKEFQNNIPDSLKDAEWLEVVDASGDALVPLYARADLSLLPRKPDFYMDLAVPIKLFEYIGFQLPVIATDSKETAKVIREYKCGLICGSTAEEFAGAVMTYYESPQLQKKCREGLKKAIAENQWISRARKVIDQLSSANKN